MPIISWPIDLDDQPYVISLDHGIFSGKRIIRVNETTVHKANKLIDVGMSEHPFQIGSHDCKITIHTIGRGVTYNFYVDEKPQEMQKFTVMQILQTMPAWGWLLELIIAFMYLTGLTTHVWVSPSELIIRYLIMTFIFLVVFFVIWMISSHKSRVLRTRLVFSLLLTLVYTFSVLASTCLCGNTR